jgi:hypothetical protein
MNGIGGGSGTGTFICTCAIDIKGNTISPAKSIVPCNSFFIFTLLSFVKEYQRIRNLGYYIYFFNINMFTGMMSSLSTYHGE